MLAVCVSLVHPSRAKTSGLHFGVGWEVALCLLHGALEGALASEREWGEGMADPRGCVGTGTEPEAVWCSLIEYRSQSVPCGHARMGRESSSSPRSGLRSSDPPPEWPPGLSPHPACVVCKKGGEVGAVIARRPCKQCLYELGLLSFVSGSSLISQQISAASRTHACIWGQKIVFLLKL